MRHRKTDFVSFQTFSHVVQLLKRWEIKLELRREKEGATELREIQLTFLPYRSRSQENLKFGRFRSPVWRIGKEVCRKSLSLWSLANGLLTWRWRTPGRRGNPLMWGNLPVHIISPFKLITFTWYCRWSDPPNRVAESASPGTLSAGVKFCQVNVSKWGNTPSQHRILCYIKFAPNSGLASEF